MCCVSENDKPVFWAHSTMKAHGIASSCSTRFKPFSFVDKARQFLRLTFKLYWVFIICFSILEKEKPCQNANKLSYSKGINIFGLDTVLGERQAGD